MTESKNILTKDAILKIKDYDIKEIEIPKWGGTVRLRSLSGKGRDEFELAVTASSSRPGTVDIRGLKALLLSMTIVDENDDLLFTKEDVDKLNEKDAASIELLWNAIQKMNGIGEDQIKETEGNLDGDRSVKPGSDSPDN